jgi:hypothetical protein
MNTSGIVNGTFRAFPHPAFVGAWTVVGKDDQGRTTHVRNEIGSVARWGSRAEAKEAAQRLNAVSAS